MGTHPATTPVLFTSSDRQHIHNTRTSISYAHETRHERNVLALLEQPTRYDTSEESSACPSKRAVNLRGPSRGFDLLDGEGGCWGYRRGGHGGLGGGDG